MNKLVPRVGLGSPASPLEVGAERAPAALTDLARVLGESGIDVVPCKGPLTTPDAATAAGQMFAEQHVDAICLAAASWFEDYLVLDMLEECDVPVLLWALPGMETGALCGAQQATCYLKQLGKPYFNVFGPVEDGDGLYGALSFLRTAALRKRLRRARVGLAGSCVCGMSEVSVNEMMLKKVLGPRIVPVDMVGLLRQAEEADMESKQKIWRRVKDAVGRVNVPDGDGLNAAGIYLAIREIAEREGLCAIAFGCYPDFMGQACLAASLLADEGLPVACEGDANGAVGMLILYLLTGQPTHNTDWLGPLPDGSVVFSHCGSGSFSLAKKPDDITLAPVRLAHRGVCALFPAHSGPVTLLNLIASGAEYQMAVIEGESIECDMVFPGNPLRVRFERPVREIIEWIHEEGIGHHWIAGHASAGREMRNVSRIVGSGLRLCYLGCD